MLQVNRTYKSKGHSEVMAALGGPAYRLNISSSNRASECFLNVLMNIYSSRYFFLGFITDYSITYGTHVKMRCEKAFHNLTSIMSNVPILLVFFIANSLPSIDISILDQNFKS